MNFETSGSRISFITFTNEICIAVGNTSLVDCDLLAKVYINLIDQKEPTLDFSIQEKINNQEINKKINYFKKIVKPTEEEINNHSDYLKMQIKKNFF